jgi:hypothetical protein
MLTIEKKISNLIQSHFPFFYTEDNPLLVEFVKKYFEWMESENQTLYHTRRISEYKDIDNTVNEFLVYFKEKYLKNIQFSTAASTKRMVKHSLDLYRSKGTSRAIDLMFKIVFDTPAEVYLPSRDIFRLSSGEWYEQYYLEVTPAPINISFVGKQVEGVQSDCKAFVEKLIRKKVNDIFIEVFIISAITPNKHFITGELVKTTGQIAIKNNPKIIGSLTSVDVLTGSDGFSVGDIVNIDSLKGDGAKGRVTEVSTVTGKVEFDLTDGGFGYRSNSNIYVSEKIFRLSNVQLDTTVFNTNYLNDFDTVFANQARINVINATSEFFIGDTIYTYFTNNTIKGYGALQRIEGNTTSANIFLSIQSGNLVAGGANSVNAYFVGANTKSANIGAGGYTNTSASAKVLGITDTIRIGYANSLPFNNNQIIHQFSDVGTISASGKIIDTSVSGLTGVLTVNTISGLFLSTKNIYDSSSNSEANVTNISIDLGVINVASQFYSNIGNILYVKDTANVVYGNSTIVAISTGSLASFQIANNLANPEIIEINTDFIRDYANTQLNAATYTPMNSPSSANLTTPTIADALTFSAITIGTISAITGINSGEGYNFDPIVKIENSLISQYRKKDIIVKISNAGGGGFFNGEIVTQPNTGAKGLLTSISADELGIRLLSFENAFANNSANTKIVGSGSGATANVDIIFENTNSKVMGLNAVVFANVVSQEGSVTKLEVIDSGFGYRHKVVGSFSSLDGQKVGSVSMLLGGRTSEINTRGREGKSLGRYRTEDGFLSSGKKLQDSDYYQDFSYEIRSSVTLDKYEAMLKQLLHVAGTKYFAATIRSSAVPVNLNVTASIQTAEFDITNFINFTADTNTVKIDTTLITADTNFI